MHWWGNIIKVKMNIRNYKIIRYFIQLFLLAIIIFLSVTCNRTSPKTLNSYLGGIVINVDEGKGYTSCENMTGVFLKVIYKNIPKKILKINSNNFDYLIVNNDTIKILLKYINQIYISKYMDSITVNMTDSIEVLYKINYPFGVVLSQIRKEFEQFIGNGKFEIRLNSLIKSKEIINTSINYSIYE